MNYYDFDANWDSFLKSWYSHEVQHALKIEIECYKPLGFFKHYQQGDPLWKHTKSLYWKLRCVARAKQLMIHEQHLTKFKKTMQTQFGFPHDTTNHYFATCFSKQVERCHPVKDTIHAFIIPELSFLLKRTMRTCAEVLFPTEIIEITTDNVITIGKHIKFDLLGFYNERYG